MKGVVPQDGNFLFFISTKCEKVCVRGGGGVSAPAPTRFRNAKRLVS